MALNATTRKRQRKQRGKNTAVYFRKFDEATDNLNIAGLTTLAEVAAHLRDNGFCRVECSFGIGAPGFSRAEAEDEECVEDNEVPIYVADEIYQVGDVVQPASGLEGIPSKQCFIALNDGQLGEPGSSEDWEETDCGCAYPETLPGDVEKDTIDSEIVYTPGSDVDDLVCEGECGANYQWVMIHPARNEADESGTVVCKNYFKTWLGWIQSWKPQSINSDVMRGDLSVCRTSAVRKGCFTRPLAAAPATADEIVLDPNA